MAIPILVAVLVIVFLLSRWINILNEYERGVVFRLGRLVRGARGPGFIFVLYPIEKMVKVSLRTDEASTARGKATARTARPSRLLYMTVPPTMTH